MDVSSKQIFLSMIEKDAVDASSFVNFMSKFSCGTNKNTTYSSELDETLEMMSCKELCLVWEKLRDFVTCTIMSLETREMDEELIEQDMKGVGQLLQYIVNLATATLSVLSTSVIPGGLLETAVILHGMLLTMPESMRDLQQNLARLYSAWWTRNLDGRTELIPNTLIYLLQLSLSPKAVRADVKRVWDISNSLTLFKIDKLMEQPLQSLLLECLRSKVYLRVAEGHKFLSLLLGLNVEFAEVVHKYILSQLPVCPKAAWTTYGKVYFQAWSTSTGDIQQTIETSCIQDLIYRAVHAQRTSVRAMFPALRAVLHSFHSQKLHKGVDAMLHRLYEPILWRSLKVANGHVRANAASLLVDIFPVCNPDSNVQQNDTLLQKQFDTLQSLLMDPYQDVRAATVSGVCRILRVYWEIIPADMIRLLLTTLTSDLAYDVASPDVRLAVINGLCGLLDQPLCHPVLKKLLPELRNFIHDASEKVRLAMINVLLAVRNIRSIKFWTIVPVEHLIARLQHDSPAICRKVVLLLHPSFVPLQKSRDELLERCLAFVGSHRDAIRPFFQYAHVHMDFADKVSYIIMLCRCILGCVRKNTCNMPNESEADTESSHEMNDEGAAGQEEDVEKELSVDQTDTICCLFEIMVILWATIESQLAKPVNAEEKNNLQRKFAIAFPEFLQAFRHPGIYSALVTLACFMPPKLVPQLSRGCLSTLRDMDPAAPPTYYSILLEAMVKWGKTDDLLDLITEWIEAGVVGHAPTVPPKKTGTKPTKKNVGFIATHPPRPTLGVDYLSCLLRHPVCRSTVLQFNHQRLVTIRHYLARITDCVEKCVVDTPSDIDLYPHSFLVSAFTLHHRLEILCHKRGDRDACITLERDFSWADATLLPLLQSKLECPTQDQDRVIAFSYQLIQVLLESGRSLLLVGCADREFTTLLADFCRLCLRTPHSARFLTHVAGVLHQICEFSATNQDETDEGFGTDCDLIPRLFDLVINSMVMAVQEDGCTEELTTSMRKVLTGVIESTYHMTREASVHGVQASIMAAIIADLTHASQMGSLDPSMEYNHGYLPIITDILLGIVAKKNSRIVLLANELDKCLRSGALSSVHMLHAALHLVASLNKHTSTAPVCVSALESRLEPLECALTDSSPESPDRLLFVELKERIVKMVSAR